MGARWYFQFLRSDLVSPMFNLSANAGFVASPVSILPHPPASGVGPLYRISFIGFPPANPLTVYQKLMAASKAAALQNVLIPYMCSNEANPYEWPLDRRLLNAPLAPFAMRDCVSDGAGRRARMDTFAVFSNVGIPSPLMVFRWGKGRWRVGRIRLPRIHLLYPARGSEIGFAPGGWA